MQPGYPMETRPALRHRVKYFCAHLYYFIFSGILTE